MNVIINNLKAQFALKLPGEDIQHQMAPSGRSTFIPPNKLNNGSVLVLIFPNEKLHIVLIKRTEYKGPHSGQISFPGGKSEPDDLDYNYTALREAHEELGLKINDVEIIGSLTPLYIPPSNFNVVPVVGYTLKKPDFKINHREVKSVFTPPIEIFLKPEALKIKTIEFSGEIVSVPYFDLDGEEVWGATAMIMNEFLAIAKRVL